MFIRNILNYELSDLQPYIDFETMDEHYNVHYKKYTENMNKAIVQYNIQIDHINPLNSLISQLKNFEEYPVEFRNNAGGFVNHMIYFQNISPSNNNYESKASNELKNMINKSFGGYNNFVEKFKNAGKNVFGSGWVWLVSNGNRLAVLTTANQDNPLMSIDTNILLGMDVWEHSYYLKHKADRAAYINDFFRVIDWAVVSSRL